MRNGFTARRHSLSRRLLCLSIGIVVMVELLVFVPDLAHERQLWLQGRLQDAQLAVLAAAVDADHPVNPAIATELLRLSGTDRITLQAADRPPMTLTGAGPVAPEHTIDLRDEHLPLRIWRALQALAVDRQSQFQVVNTNDDGSRMEFVLRSHNETRALRGFAREFFWLSLAIACLTGVLVYVAVSLLMVRPMRRIIDSIAAFRAAPERGAPLDPGAVSLLGNDELAVAGRELAAMQEELRDALWRNARLAALGTAVAKISHDLRGILAPALLSADRLQSHPDEKVQRAGDILVRTVERATDLVKRTLDFVRGGPPPLELKPVELAPLVDEVAEVIRTTVRPLAVRHTITPALLVEADRNQLFRVLANLLRNAAEAGARSVSLAAKADKGIAAIDVADDGPGLPEAVQSTLFRPFASSTRHGGTGLGLAIAHDLMVAHGGEIELASSGKQGTVFRLTLRTARPRMPAPTAAS